MIKLSTTIVTLNWLQTKLNNGENGIIYNDSCPDCFDSIQNFIESVDHNSKTPAIYYQAFPEENAAQFLNTLGKELCSKLGICGLNSNQSLLQIIETAELKMVIIDQSHLHPLDTLQNLLDFFARCNVALILVGSRSKMEIAQIHYLSAVADWEQFTSCCQDEALRT